MRILSLDYDPVYGDDSTRERFTGDTSVFDYDVVIWDPAASLHSYDSYNKYRGLPALTEHASVKAQNDVTRRRREFSDFVNAGRTLVVIVRPPQVCYIDNGKRTYSGTGRNRSTTTHVEPLDLLAAVPSETFKTEPAQGTRIELLKDGPIVTLMRKHQEFMGYDAILLEPPGTPLARVAGTDRVVASMLTAKNGGHLLLLPEFDFWVEPDDDDDEDAEARWSDAGHVFQQDLLAAVASLNGSLTAARPAWADSYATKPQRSLAQKVGEQQQRIEDARAQLAQLQQEHDMAQQRNQLFMGTGRSLELEVKGVLELLGGVVTEPEPGRDDWKVDFDGKRAVVEVKGVGKSAAEKHAAQLEKWVSADFEASGVMPKGLLVVNTWRDLALDERVDADFPAQMLPYCEARGHCLVTGLQLFVIREEIEQDDTKAKYWRDKILALSGVLQDVPDWRDHIEKSDLESAQEDV